jgi:hypothetical protein
MRKAKDENKIIHEWITNKKRKRSREISEKGH